MQREEEIGLIKEIIGLADQKSAYLDATIGHSPIARYASPERFERENAMIFCRKPVIAAHSTELDGPSAFVTREISGMPVLLTRDEDGVASAFLNICRHRGARLEREGAGCKRVFTCPYHGWSYTNRGDLRGVPQEKQGFPDLPRAERGLRRLPVAEAFGFIWVIADPDASDIPDIRQWFGTLAPDLDWLDLGGHRIAAETNLEIAANWKTLAEGGIEAYHFRVAHKETIAPYFTDNLSTYRMFGSHMRSVLPRVTMPELHETPETEWQIRRDANLLYTLVPTTQLLVQQDHVVWIHMTPRSEGQTTVRMVTLVPADEPDTEEMQAHWDRNHQITLATLGEDFELGEEIQAGFASRGNPSHLFGRFEGALNRFNLVIEEMLRG